MRLQNLIKKYVEDHPVNKDGWLELIPLVGKKRIRKWIRRSGRMV